MSVIDVYTDGSCMPNPGPGGWGWWLTTTCTDGRTLTISSYAGTMGAKSTNNKMELMGVINALETLPHRYIYHIYSDSTYVVKGLTSTNDYLTAGSYTGWMRGWIKSGWKKPKCNKDLWKRLHKIVQRHLLRGSAIKISWVKAHVGIYGNEKADALANAGVIHDLDKPSLELEYV